jgi:hypothetical protein
VLGGEGVSVPGVEGGVAGEGVVITGTPCGMLEAEKAVTTTTSKC